MPETSNNQTAAEGNLAELFCRCGRIYIKETSVGNRAEGSQGFQVMV